MTRAQGVTPGRGLRAALLAAVLAGPVAAADEDGRYALEGPGRIDCARYVAIAEAGGRDLDVLASWTLGYLSAHNRVLPQTFDLTPWQDAATVMRLVGQFCTANPGRSFEDGLQELIAYLARSRLTRDSETVAVGAGGKATVLYRDTLEQVRSRLGEAGYPPGNTAESLALALRSFQRAEGLPDSGLPDQATLAILLK